MAVEIQETTADFFGRSMSDAEITIDGQAVTADSLINLVYGDTPDLATAAALSAAIIAEGWANMSDAEQNELRNMLSGKDGAAAKVNELIESLGKVNETIAEIQRLVAPYGGSAMLTALAIAGDKAMFTGFLEESPLRAGLVYRALLSALEKLYTGVVGEMTPATIDALNAFEAEKRAK